MNSQHLYKYTQAGGLVQILPDVIIGFDDLITNKDSRTIYIASAGKIFSISNGKMRYLVGPREPFDGHDGVGNGADVSAHNLALSKNENTIYFTDATHRTVRKLVLK